MVAWLSVRGVRRQRCSATGAKCSRQTLQDLLRLVDVATLVSRDEVGHGDDLLVVFVTAIEGEVSSARREARNDDLRLGLVRVEGVDGAVHQHVSEDEVLEDLDTLRRSRFVVALERFEEVDLRLGPILCSTR